MKIGPVGAELVHVNRQGEDERCFGRFINAPKIKLISLLIHTGFDSVVR